MRLRKTEGQLDINFCLAPHFPFTNRKLACDRDIVCLEHNNDAENSYRLNRRYFCK